MITFLVAMSEVAVAALVTEHPNRSVTHPSAANRPLNRGLCPINPAAHIR
jgi:hypothetical protein